MAIRQTNFCPACQKEVTESRPNSDFEPTCIGCRVKAAASTKAKVLAELEDLPIQTRLSRIEERLYDLKVKDNPFKRG